MADLLTRGAIARIKQDEPNLQPVLQVRVCILQFVVSFHFGFLSLFRLLVSKD
jgi:hypothetical protein